MSLLHGLHMSDVKTYIINAFVTSILQHHMCKVYQGLPLLTLALTQGKNLVMRLM